MNKRIVGRCLAAIGLAAVFSQVPADRPWQALVAVGIFMLIAGGMLLADSEPAGTENE